MSKIAWTISILLIVTTLSGCAYTIETGPQGTRQAASIGVPAVGVVGYAPRGAYGGFYGGPYYGGAGFVGAPIGWGWGGFGWGGGFGGVFIDGHGHHHHDHHGHHDGNDTVNNFNNEGGDVNMGDGSNFDGSADGGDGGGDGGDGGGQ